MIRNDCINSIGADAAASRPRFTWKVWARAGIRLFLDDAGRLMDLLKIWQRRAVDRQNLRDMDARLLKDIGIGRIDADREAAKPFWRG